MIPGADKLLPSVSCEGDSFTENCNIFFGERREFVVDCKLHSVLRCRRAANVFMQYKLERPRGWKKVTALVKILLVAMPAAPITAVCNKAHLLGWTIVVRNDDAHVLHLKPAVNRRA